MTNGIDGAGYPEGEPSQIVHVLIVESGAMLKLGTAQGAEVSF